MGILSAEYLLLRSMHHRTKQNNPVQLFFGRDMILKINHIANWRYTCQQKQTNIEKGVIHENSTKIDHDYNIGDKFMVRKNRLINTKHFSGSV